MGFKIHWDTNLIRQNIGRMLTEIRSPYNDGWTASSVKKDLYDIKCWLDDEYKNLPVFTVEDDWEKERVINILKK
jgi:hypothetical protein